MVSPAETCSLAGLLGGGTARLRLKGAAGIGSADTYRIGFWHDAEHFSTVAAGDDSIPVYRNDVKRLTLAIGRGIGPALFAANATNLSRHGVALDTRRVCNVDTPDRWALLEPPTKFAVHDVSLFLRDPRSSDAWNREKQDTVLRCCSGY